MSKKYAYQLPYAYMFWFFLQNHVDEISFLEVLSMIGTLILLSEAGSNDASHIFLQLKVSVMVIIIKAILFTHMNKTIRI